MKTILLTNDDGYLSAGIQQLKRTLSELYDVYVIAPDRERSAVSMSLTINHPLRMKQIGEKEFILDGTPSDCVNIGLQRVVPRVPDFVISGMNEGENLCEDVFYSGTVAGAFSGHSYGIPSMAVSLVINNNTFQYEAGAAVVKDVLARLLPVTENTAVYNLNIPGDHNGKIAITTIGLKKYQPSISERTDPRGRTYYWIGAGNPKIELHKGSDLEAIRNGFISLSALQYDLNTPPEMKKLQEVFNESE